jgi:hypothetical protein
MASQNALLTQPTNFTAITPSDTADVTPTCNLGVLVGTAGSLAVMGVYDTVATTITVVAGQYVAGRFKRIMATGTSGVTGIVGCSGGRKGP